MDPLSLPPKYSALIVEDEQAISNLLKLHLVENNFVVDQSYTAEAGFAALGAKKYDLCLLDWMLPGGMQGIDLLKRIRQNNSDLKVIMVTAKANPESIVEGIEAGADDYLTKPFDARVLLARIKNLLKQRSGLSNLAKQDPSAEMQSSTVGSQGSTVGSQSSVVVSRNSAIESQVMSYDGLEIDFEKYLVKFQGEEIHLTPSEYKLLGSLVNARGKVLTRDQLIDQIQGEDVSVTGRTIDTHIFALRKKLKEWSEYIETIRGVGYRILVDTKHRTESET